MGACPDTLYLLKETRLIHEILRGNIAQAQTLIAARAADMNASDARGGTALMAAAETGHPGIVESLLEAGADVDARKKDGSTALMKAAQRGNTEIVRMLLSHGADVTPIDDRGNTALTLAGDAAHAEVAELLRKAGAVR